MFWRHPAPFAAVALLTMSATGFGQAAAAEHKRPMTFADLQAMKRISDPQISPGGHWVLFSVTDVSVAKNTKTNHLWVVPLRWQSEAAGPAKTAAGERQLTVGSGESSGRFAPDGRQVAFVAAGQIQLAPWDEASGTLGTAHALTAVATGADGPVWSPDSRRLLFVSPVYPVCSNLDVWHAEDTCDKEKDDAAAASPVKAQLWDHLLYRHWDQYTGEKRSHVLVVDAADGRQIRDLTPRSVVGDAETPTFSLGGPIGYAWAPDSQEIAFVANRDAVPAASTNNDVFTLALTAGAKPVKISTSPGSDDAPAYSPDGRYLAFRSQARAGYESDRFRLMLYERARHSVLEVAPRFPGWVDEFLWDAQTPSLYFTSAYEGEERVYTVAAGGSPRLLRQGGEFGSLATVSRKGGYLGSILVATKMRLDSPPEIVLLGKSDTGHAGIEANGHFAADHFGITVTEDSVETQLTQLNRTLIDQLDLARLETFTFPGANTTPVQGFLLRPPNFDPAKKYPLKFLIHGGPQGAWGDAWSYRWNPELFAADGYVVVMINPRGSTGYGQPFIDGVNGDWGGKPFLDLMRGLDYAEKKFPFIDKSRECALGASYGGFMANWILTHTNRFACIVTHDGMYNPESAYGTTEELWFNEWEFRRQTATGAAAEPAQPWRYANGPAEQDPFRKWSPMRSIANAKTPTLVIHGQRDYRLDVSEGLQLFTALQRRGVPSEMLYFPDEGHWVLKPQNSELWYKTVNEWCDRWTHREGDAARSAPANDAGREAGRSSAVARSSATKGRSQAGQPDR